MDLDRIKFETTLAPTNEASSYRPPMVGVFAKQSINKDEIMLTIPKECVFDEHSPLLEDLISGVVDKALDIYRKNVSEGSDQYSAWDSFHKFKGQVFCEDELRLSLHLTILFYAQKQAQGRSSGDSGTPTSSIEMAFDHWVPYFNTLPNDDYESLIFNWTKQDIDNLRGTATYAHVVRLRKEVKDNWEQSFRDCLVDYLQAEFPSSSSSLPVDQEVLESCYKHAICTLYSRMHGLFEVVAGQKTTSQNNTRCVCPLVDLINGDREDSPRCNTQLLHHPSSHVALQATRDIQAGEELLFSYGEINNLIFIAKFGFMPLSDAGNPQLHNNDVVYLLPPPSAVWEESDSRWQSLTSARDGKCLARSHLIENSPFVTAQTGTPFALIGNPIEMMKTRNSETWRPPYLTNSHLYAMMSLTKECAEEEAFLEPWEPGVIILEMIDYRLAQLPKITNSIADDKRLLETQQGNTKTGTLYRMLEREILQMWRHTIATHYEVYGETDHNGAVFEVPAAIINGCATCQAELSGPLKACPQCKAVSYCGRTCQVADWKAGHKQACRSHK